jgi:hypothetical protein
MNFFSNIKDRVAKSILGDMVADLGSFPIDESGGQIAMSIRRHEGKPPHLQLKITSGNNTRYTEVQRISEWADQVERAAHEVRKHI